MDPNQPAAQSIPQKDWQTQVFEFSAKNSQLIIHLFWIPYLAILGVLVSGGYQAATQGPMFQLFYNIGRTFGQLALLLLGVVVLPGILGRFRIEIKVTRIITLFRRQLGIVVFLLAYTHFMVLRGVQRMVGVLPSTPPFPLFETIGVFALSLLFPLFLTSNNWSVKHLGRWWKRLHRIIYVILWLVVLHTGLQRVSIWTILIGFFAILEVASLIYDYRRKRQAKPVQGTI